MECGDKGVQGRGGREDSGHRGMGQDIFACFFGVKY